MNIDQLHFFRDEIEKQAEDRWYHRNPLLVTAPLAVGGGAALGYAAATKPRTVGVPLAAALTGAVGHQMYKNPSLRPWSAEGKAAKRARNVQISKEKRDPRLYSNLRGMATFESPEERVAAHKLLGKGDGTILGAMKEGFTRSGRSK